MRTDTAHRNSWLAAIVMLVATMLSARQTQVLEDPDTYWHLATGRLILDTLSLPTADPFSFTVSGKTWILQEWLSQVIYAGAFALGGWHGVVLLTVLAACLAIAILAAHLLRSLSGVRAAIACVAAVLPLDSHFLARPHVLAWPLIVLWSALIIRAADERTSPPLWATLLMVVWANLHGSYLLGFAVGLFFGAETILKSVRSADRWSVIGRWTLFGAVTCVAALITPQAVEKVVHISDFLTAQSAFTSEIHEWESPNFRELNPLQVWLYPFLAIALGAGFRLPISRVVFFLIMLHMAFRHVRHTELVALLVPLAFAAPLALQLPLANQTSILPSVRLPGVVKKSGALAAAVVVLFLLSGLGDESHTPAPRFSPHGALGAVPNEIRAGRVLNDYNFGGFLISKGVPTFIDGRDVFGNSFFAEMTQVIGSNQPQAAAEYLDRFAISWTLLAPDRPFVSALDALPGWRRIYSDNLAVVHVRESSVLGENGPPSRPCEVFTGKARISCQAEQPLQLRFVLDVVRGSA